MDNDATVTAADVARLAGVGRAAVSNWRRRHDDFPAPVAGTATSPAFSLREIGEWLRAQGKLAEAPPEERVWQELRGAAGRAPLGEAVAFAGAFLVFREREPEGWAALERRSDYQVAARLPKAVRRAAPELPGDLLPATLPAGQVPALRAVAGLAGEQGIARTFDHLRRRYFEVHTRRVYDTPGAVIGAMLDFVPEEARTILDPACGSGEVLVAALDRLDEPERLLGEEVDATSAALAAVRVALRTGIGEVHAGDSLRADAFPGLAGDAVVCNPPFNDRNWGYEELTSDPRWEYGLPPRMESELAWVQHALAHVRPGGTVAMLMPPAAANRRSGRRIRAELLRRGVLRAVAGLPMGAVPNVGVQLSIWALRRPGPDVRPAGRLLVVNTADPDDFPEQISRAWRRFLDDPEAEYEEPGLSSAVRIIDLLDDEVDLSPARHVPRRATGTGFAADRARLAELITALNKALSDLAPASESDGAPPMTTLGEQARAGTVVIRQSPLRMETGEGDLPVLTLRDVTEGGPPTGRTAPVEGQVTLRRYDVVLPAISRGAEPRIIDEDGGVLGPHLFLVRPDRDHLDPEFIAGFLRVAALEAASRTSTGSSRLDLRRARLPRLTLPEQRRYADAFRTLSAFEALLQETSTSGADLVRSALLTLATGTLSPS